MRNPLAGLLTRYRRQNLAVRASVLFIVLFATAIALLSVSPYFYAGVIAPLAERTGSPAGEENPPAQGSGDELLLPPPDDRPIIDWPTLTVSLSAAPLSGKAPLEVTFVATVENPPADVTLYYDWYFGDGAWASDGPTQVHLYTLAGTMFASVSVHSEYYYWIADGSGGMVDGSTGVAIYPPPEEMNKTFYWGYASVVITVEEAFTVVYTAAPSSGVAPLMVTFWAEASGSPGPYEYYWLPGDVWWYYPYPINVTGPDGRDILLPPEPWPPIGEPGQTYVHTYEWEGYYLATLAVIDTTLGVMQVYMIPIEVLPYMALEILWTSEPTPEGGLLVTFTAKVVGGVEPYRYVWNFGDGFGSTEGPIAKHTYSSNAGAWVTLSVLDATDRIAVTGTWVGEPIYICDPATGVVCEEPTPTYPAP